MIEENDNWGWFVDLEKPRLDGKKINSINSSCKQTTFQDVLAIIKDVLIVLFVGCIAGFISFCFYEYQIPKHF
jgi:hypothetical protein